MSVPQTTHCKRALKKIPIPSTGVSSTRLPSLHTWQRKRDGVDTDRRNRSLLTLRRRSSKPSSPNVDATTAGPPSSAGPAVSMLLNFVNFNFCLWLPKQFFVLRARLSPLHTIEEAALCSVHVPASRSIQKKQSCTAQRKETQCRRDGSSCRMLGNSTCG